jgi:hypothetical protein
VTALAGDIIYASDLNEIYDATVAKPIGRLRQGTAQTGIVNSTATAITFTATDEIDTADFHSTSTNTSRVTPTVAGYYWVQGGVALGGATDYTVVQAYIARNGSALAPAFRITPSASSQTLVLTAAAVVECNGSTDYFEIYYVATRSGAGTSATVVSAQFACVLEWQLSRPL